jgi:hypothetical protein
MAHISSYSHHTEASIPAATWDQAWFALSSWKGYLQSIPGFLAIRMSGYPLDNGDVRFRVITVWDYPEQLEAWLGSDWSSESMLGSLSPAAYDLVEHAWEDFG